MYRLSKNSLIVGCNYHVTWQDHKAIRFVLADIKGARAKLLTRRTRKIFWTDTQDLVFIMSKTNIDKARSIIEKEVGDLI